MRFRRAWQVDLPMQTYMTRLCLVLGMLRYIDRVGKPAQEFKARIDLALQVPACRTRKQLLAVCLACRGHWAPTLFAKLAVSCVLGLEDLELGRGPA